MEKSLENVDSILKQYGDIEYSDNGAFKKFVDELYADKILTGDEYSDISGEGLFDNEENASYLKDILIKKGIKPLQAKEVGSGEPPN